MTEAAALKAFVRGRISFSALRNALADSTDFIFFPNGTVRVSSRRALPPTMVRLQDVHRMLARYQRGEVTIEELATWGIVLHTLDGFEVRGISEARQEAIWDVIGQFSVAAVNKKFGESRVSELLEQLQKMS